VVGSCAVVSRGAPRNPLTSEYVCFVAYRTDDLAIDCHPSAWRPGDSQQQRWWIWSAAGNRVGSARFSSVTRCGRSWTYRSQHRGL